MFLKIERNLLVTHKSTISFLVYKSLFSEKSKSSKREIDRYLNDYSVSRLSNFTNFRMYKYI